MRRLALVLVAALACLAAAASAGAQEQGPRLLELGDAKFPDRAYVLTLPDRASITADDVRLRENGDLVQDFTLTPGDEIGRQQFGTVLVVDASSSMHRGAIEGAMRAARTFAERRNPEQPLGLITFNDEARVVLPLTTDGAQIREALAPTPRLARETHLYDATSAAVRVLREADVQAGTVVVLSDGSDTGSAATAGEVARQAREASARVYTVGLRTRAFSATSLRELAEATRGVYVEAGSTTRLDQLYRELSAALSNQFVLRYRSLMPLGEQVEVAVRVSGQDEVAFAGYTTKAIPAAEAGGDGGGGEPFLETTAGALVISLGCALLLGFAVLVALAPRRSVRARVEQYIASPVPDEKAWSATLIERVFGAESARARAPGRRWTAFATELELAGIRMSPEAVVFWTTLVTVLVGWLFVATAGAGGLFLAALVPVGLVIWIRVAVDRRRRAFDEQLPDNLQVIASAMRAGHTFVGAIGVVLEDTPEPSRREFRRIMTDEQVGVPLQEALARVARRMDSVDFGRVALVTTLQRETGGNTAEVMDRLTETIRERMELRRVVRTLTAQGRLSLWVVSALAPALLLIMLAINPDYVDPLFTETAGLLLLAVGAAMQVAGMLVIRRIVRIDV